MLPALRFPIVIVLLIVANSAFAQVLFERKDLAVMHGWVEGEKPTKDLSGQKTYESAAWRAKMLTQFPRADADKDGSLTEAEAIQYHMLQARMFTPQGKELEFLPKDVKQETVYVEMRDGKKLPVEVFLPAGAGPWPVVLCRTSRGRIDSALDYGNELLRMGYAFVGGDLTPEGDFIDADVLGRETGRQNLTREDRAALNARRSQRNAGQDGYDTIEWIARQPWCNGQIDITGYSEGSAQSKNAAAENPPHLNGVVTAIGTISRPPALVRSGGDGRAAQADLPTSWSPPTSDPRGSITKFVQAGPDLKFHFNDRTGWFDASAEGTIKEWLAVKDNGNATLIMGYGGHGPLNKATRLPPAFGDCDILLREVEQFRVLKVRIPNSPSGSRMIYFLMGDATDPSAPGNVWKVTTQWPPANEPTAFYFDAGNALRTAKPQAAAVMSYVHDPKNPIRSLHGARGNSGPADQSVLKDRKDILRFDSPVLKQPIEMAGEAEVELHVSTDVPDTVFIVTLVDIYPDGYEWPIRDAAFMLRFRNSGAAPQAAKPDEVYPLNFKLPSTAIVINAGHRVGVRVSSSAFPLYEIHPNTWDAIDSYEASKVANNRIHIGESRIILPIVTPDPSTNYVIDNLAVPAAAGSSSP